MSPYRVALPRDVQVEADELQLRVDFHEESVVVHDFAACHGGTGVRSKAVSALDVAHALARELDLATGLLPPDTLWWAQSGAGARVAIWRPPQVTPLRVRETYGAKPRQRRLPMPGLVFVCLPGGQAPYVFAARERPRTVEDQLFHCPTFNVFTSGRICVGTHVFPTDPAAVPVAFFASYFSVTGDTATGKSRRHPESIGRLWDEVDGKAAYPVADLVPQLTVADAMGIGE